MAFSTRNYLAAQQANDCLLAHAFEEAFGQTPKGAYQKTRLTGESFRINESRSRPNEINGLAEASEAVTTQVTVSGTLSGALSYGTYDDFIAATLCSGWQGDVLRNDRIVRTFTFIEKIGDGFFIRPGAFCTKSQLTFSQGNFAQVSLDFTAANQLFSRESPATGYQDQTSSLVLNTVQNFNGIRIEDTTPSGCVKEFQITLAREGAGADYGMGHADACGIRPGETLVSGQVQIYFKDWGLYEKYASGWRGPVEATVSDDDGNGYTFSIYNAQLINPVINAGSKNTSIVATFDFEANPKAGGGTIEIKRFRKTPAASPQTPPDPKE